VNHLGQAIHVLDQKRATLALDNADARQAIELSGHGLTVRAHAASDLHMGWRRDVGSDITGFRPTEIIVDDPIEPEKGSSELAKVKIRSWISSSVLTRFEDNAKNVFILVMHRVAPDDLAGTLQAQGGYRIVSLPLVAEKKETFGARKRTRGLKGSSQVFPNAGPEPCGSR
jgi:hypothetical protein